MPDKNLYTDITPTQPELIPHSMINSNINANNVSPSAKRSFIQKLFSDVDQGKIYTKKVRGFFQKLRRYMSWVLLSLFFILPWLEVQNRPAVYFDLEAQKFHIFTLSFWPQDGVFLVYLLVLAAFLLIAATLVIGRAWCGFTCPQTVWTFLFMWVEDKCEGDRNQRIKLDKKALGFNKLLRKTAKHTGWLLISLATAYTFVGYFYEIAPLVADTVTFEMHYLGVFWIIFFTVATYLNAGWLREKVCMHMCPYARFQAVMYTKETLVVTYDRKRGENRGKRKKGATVQNEQLGDCVDCSVCVQVCPVDIDIRDGLQYPCIDCGLCIDACDNIMQKMGFAPGLIRFSAQNDLATKQQAWKKPRVWILGAISLLACAIFGAAIESRESVSIDVIRDRNGALYRTTELGIENNYQVKVNNVGDDQQVFLLDISPSDQFAIVGESKIHVAKGQVDTLIVRVHTKQNSSDRYKSTIKFLVKSRDGNTILAEQNSSFIAPR